MTIAEQVLSIVKTELAARQLYKAFVIGYLALVAHSSLRSDDSHSQSKNQAFTLAMAMGAQLLPPSHPVKSYQVSDSTRSVAATAALVINRTRSRSRSNSQPGRTGRSDSIA